MRVALAIYASGHFPEFNWSEKRLAGQLADVVGRAAGPVGSQCSTTWSRTLLHRSMGTVVVIDSPA